MSYGKRATEASTLQRGKSTGGVAGSAGQQASAAQRTRTRFAPSPTGFLHVGGIRTALFAWLVARADNGQFVLRLEDTDKSREVSGAEEHIIDSLNALGLDYDEGPDKGGPFGPYRQSERLIIYKKWANELISSGRAYADPYTPEELEALRDNARKQKKPFLFREHRPKNPPKWDGTTALRFKSEPKSYSWHDEVMGDLSARPEAIDDFIIIKADGFPTYNFAHIVDDFEMKITHVIRSQEFLPSVPRYLNLYEALSFSPPKLATLPYVLGPDGKKKLSKRDGAKDVLDYVRAGFLPEAITNFIAALGWNDGTNQEIYSRQELVSRFKLSRVQKSGAKFDEQKLAWLNGHYTREMELNKLCDAVANYWGESASSFKDNYKKKVLSLVQERLKYFSELPVLTWFFFEEPETSKAVELLLKQKIGKKLGKEAFSDILHSILKTAKNSNFNETDLESQLRQLAEALSMKPSDLFMFIRIVVFGSEIAPPLFASLTTLGKDKALARLKKALDSLT